ENPSLSLHARSYSSPSASASGHATWTVTMTCGRPAPPDTTSPWLAASVVLAEHGDDNAQAIDIQAHQRNWRPAMRARDRSIDARQPGPVPSPRVPAGRPERRDRTGAPGRDRILRSAPGQRAAAPAGRRVRPGDAGAPARAVPRRLPHRDPLGHDDRRPR